MAHGRANWEESEKTWIDWRHSVKKKVREYRRQKERGFQTKTLSALEVRAIRLFRKLESGKFQLDTELKDLDLPEVEQEESIESEATIEPVKIEDVLCISENSNSSSYDDFFSETSVTSPSPKPVESSSSLTSKAPVSGAIKAHVTAVPVKDNVPSTSCVVNSVYVVSTKAIPPLVVKKASSAAVNTAVVIPQEPPRTPLVAKIKQEVIEEVDISDNAAKPECSPAKNAEKTSTEENMENVESSEDEFECFTIPPKTRSEDPLGGLPLTLQNSILERLDTLSRNIETNTCALTILAKAVNDSAEMNMRAANHLAKSLSKIGNMMGSYLEGLNNNKQQEM